MISVISDQDKISVMANQNRPLEKLQIGRFKETEVIKTRGESRAVAAPKMELFVAKVNSFKSLNIFKKTSILDVAAALDLPLKT